MKAISRAVVFLFIFSSVSACSKALPMWGTVPDFSMTDQSARPFVKKELDGKIWVADFIYTGCGTACPMLTRRMAELQKRYADAPDVCFVSFSVDPEVDTPQRLDEYASRFGADPEQWKFLTGPAENVRRTVTEGFKLSMAPAENTPDIFHSEKFVLVDRMGRIRGYYDADPAGLKRLAKDIKGLLKEKGKS